MVQMAQRRRPFLCSADRFQSARMTIMKAIGATQKGSGLRDQGRPAIATWCSRFVISCDKSQPTSLYVSKAKAAETLGGGGGTIVLFSEIADRGGLSLSRAPGMRRISRHLL